MPELLTIKVDADTVDYLDSVDVESLFPAHYSPSVIDSDEGVVVDVAFNGGAGRFLFNELDIDCQFNYFDEDEDYDNDFDEVNAKSDGLSTGLVEYVAEQITAQTGFETNYTASNT